MVACFFGALHEGFSGRESFRPWIALDGCGRMQAGGTGDIDRGIGALPLGLPGRESERFTKVPEGVRRP